MAKTTPWTTDENSALVALYFAMLDKAKAGQSYNKAALIRQFRGEHIDRHNLEQDEKRTPLSYRSRGSIEAKLMNASAAHRDILIACGKSTEAPHQTMAAYGYKAWGNYQASLKAAMAAALERREGLSQATA